MKGAVTVHFEGITKSGKTSRIVELVWRGAGFGLVAAWEYWGTRRIIWMPKLPLHVCEWIPGLHLTVAEHETQYDTYRSLGKAPTSEGSIRNGTEPMTCAAIQGSVEHCTS